MLTKAILKARQRSSRFFVDFLCVLAVGCWLSAIPDIARAVDLRLDEAHVQSGGIQRSYLIHPPSLASRSQTLRPLLLVLHGGGGTARSMVTLTRGRFEELSEQYGLFVAYPQGIRRVWNDGRTEPHTLTSRSGIDDVEFLSSLIADLEARYPINPEQVFVAGISNGGMMALRLGCGLPGKIRGVAAIAASLPREIETLCGPGGRVCLVILDGTSDPIVPYAGGQVKVLWNDRGEVIGAEKTAALWASKNHCSARAATTNELPDLVDDDTRISEISYGNCASGGKVLLYRIEGGGHTWPGGSQYLPERIIGKTSRDANACILTGAFSPT